MKVSSPPALTLLPPLSSSSPPCLAPTPSHPLNLGLTETYMWVLKWHFSLFQLLHSIFCQKKSKYVFKQNIKKGRGELGYHKMTFNVFFVKPIFSHYHHHQYFHVKTFEWMQLTMQCENMSSCTMSPYIKLIWNILYNSFFLFNISFR